MTACTRRHVDIVHAVTPLSFLLVLADRTHCLSKVKLL